MKKKKKTAPRLVVIKYETTSCVLLTSGLGCTAGFVKICLEIESCLSNIELNTFSFFPVIFHCSIVRAVVDKHLLFGLVMCIIAEQSAGRVSSVSNSIKAAYTWVTAAVWKTLSFTHLFC